MAKPAKNVSCKNAGIEKTSIATEKKYFKQVFRVTECLTPILLCRFSDVNFRSRIVFQPNPIIIRLPAWPFHSGFWPVPVSACQTFSRPFADRFRIASCGTRRRPDPDIQKTHAPGFLKRQLGFGLCKTLPFSSSRNIHGPVHRFFPLRSWNDPLCSYYRQSSCKRMFQADGASTTGRSPVRMTGGAILPAKENTEISVRNTILTSKLRSPVSLLIRGISSRL